MYSLNSYSPALGVDEGFSVSNDSGCVVSLDEIVSPCFYPSSSRYGSSSGTGVFLGSLYDVFMAVNSRWLNFFSIMVDRFSYIYYLCAI